MKNSLEDRIIRERERERFLWEEGSKWNTNYRKWVVSVPDRAPNSRAFHGNQTDRKEKENSPIELPIFARRMGEGGGRENEKEECRKISIFLIFSFVSEARHHRDENTKRTKPRFVHVSTVLARTMVP